TGLRAAERRRLDGLAVVVGVTGGEARESPQVGVVDVAVPVGRQLGVATAGAEGGLGRDQCARVRRTGLVVLDQAVGVTVVVGDVPDGALDASALRPGHVHGPVRGDLDVRLAVDVDRV